MEAQIKLSKFAEKRNGTLNKFYTHTAVGQLICDFLPRADPWSVLDLGAGEGSLSSAVADRWPKANFVTVDIDASCVDSLHSMLAEKGVIGHRHFQADVLTAQLSFLPGYGQFDLAVCNPPFFKPQWRKEFASFIEEAGLGQALSISEVSAEAVFLAQNLNALRKGGSLVLISPDGMATGRRSQMLRRTLLRDHKVETVIQLPNNAFKDTDAYCFITFLTKGAGPTEKVKLLQYNKKRGFSEPLYVSADEAEVRMDYDYHDTHRPIDGSFVTLRMLGADVRRGSLSSVDLRATQFSTFHTSGYDRERLVFSGSVPQEAEEKLVIAGPGDILVARIDRNFHKKIAFVESGRAAISDCVYRVRVPASIQVAVFDALRSPKGEAALKAMSKGVSARLLGKADFLDLRIDCPDLVVGAKELLEERKSPALLL